MILLSHTTTQMSMLPAQWPTSEFGMPKIDKNSSEFKSQILNATALPLWMTEKASSPDGMMVKSEPFYPNPVNWCMSFLMLTSTESLLSPQPVIARELFLEEVKEKSESGKSVNRLKWWKLQWKNTEEECGQSKWERTMNKQFLLLTMDLALSGISRVSPD